MKVRRNSKDPLFQMFVIALLFYQCVTNASQDDLRSLTLAHSFQTTQTMVIKAGRFIPFGNDFFCKLHSGYFTMPRSLKPTSAEFATRSLWKTNNLKVIRKKSLPEQLMFGPCDYFGTLYNAHTHMFTIQYDANNQYTKYIPQQKNRSIPQQVHSKPAISENEWEKITYHWLSGKKHPAIDDKKHEYKLLGKRWPSNSLFVDPGIMELAKDIRLKQIIATNFDLSAFKAKLTVNSNPFVLPSSGTNIDDYSIITYFYGKKYEEYALANDGIFLEHHQFAQSITPLHSGASGFVILAKENGFTMETKNRSGTLDMIGVQIPYGYTLIIDKGCVHGDTNLKGLYMMAMTTNHKIMNTADSVFLKNVNTKENIKVTLENEKNVVMDIPYQLIPLVSLNSEDEKIIFSTIYNSVDNLSKIYTKVVFNPFSKLWWKYYQNNIIVLGVFTVLLCCAVIVIVVMCRRRRRNKLKGKIEKNTEKVIENDSQEIV